MCLGPQGWRGALMRPEGGKSSRPQGERASPGRSWPLPVSPVLGPSSPRFSLLWTEKSLVGSINCARSWNRSSASCPATAKGSRTGEEAASQSWATLLSKRGRAHAWVSGLSPGLGGTGEVTGPNCPQYTWAPFISALLWALQAGRG